MAGDAKKLQPIIVKRVKKGGHGHHGGAWKIAYADFVTAMMAFFLLMWLLGSTTEGDRKGIADYFSSPLKIALLSSGSGSGDASHVIKGGGQDLTRSTGQVRRGDVPQQHSTINLQALKEEQRRAEQARLEELKAKVERQIAAHPRLAPLAAQIRLDMTRDGLRIQIVDERNRPMFASGSAEMQPYMRELLREIGGVLAGVPNRLTLEGHTDAQPF
ncbi:MAG: flagellar motor protein MotB, partial [Rubrivivax sp.]|nr:flagellar motor protein MotB [Rubrivivax sp.]